VNPISLFASNNKFSLQTTLSGYKHIAFFQRYAINMNNC